MATRTFVRYVRLLWSWLGTGVTKDKMTFGPSAEIPSRAAAKNTGAFSFVDMANPWIFEKPNLPGIANDGYISAHSSADSCFVTPNV